MSYILDALRKAEVERERERQRQVVPGIHAAGSEQPVYLAYQGTNSAMKWWVAAGVLSLAAASAVVWLRSHNTPAAPPSNPVPIPSAPVAVTTPPQSAPAPEPPSVVKPTDKQTVVPTKVTIPSQRPDTGLPQPVTTPPHLVAPVVREAAPQIPTTMPKAAPSLLPDKPAPAAIAPARTPTTMPASRSQPASGNANDIPAWSDLPEHIRKAMPPIAVAGAVVSESTREWALLVNDKVLSPGSLVAADLYLVEVSANSAVFNFRGQKFRMDR